MFGKPKDLWSKESFSSLILLSFSSISLFLLFLQEHLLHLREVQSCCPNSRDICLSLSSTVNCSCITPCIIHEVILCLEWNLEGRTSYMLHVPLPSKQDTPSQWRQKNTWNVLFFLLISYNIEDDRVVGNRVVIIKKEEEYFWQTGRQTQVSS